MIEQFLERLWLTNIELSLLLLIFLALRMLVQRATENINTYLFWSSIPIAVLGYFLFSLVEFQHPVVTFSFNEILPIQTYLVDETRTSGLWYTAGLVWVLGVILCAFRLVFRHIQLHKIFEKVDGQFKHKFVSNYPIILVTNTEFSPAAYGFIQPQIYFPVHLINELSAEQVTLILEHEELHIKQKHLWLNLLWDLSVCCLWFNPVIYIARNRFRHDQEIYCDSAVLNDKGADSRESYGLALLQTIAENNSENLLCSWKSFNQLEERILNINKPFNRGWQLTLITCVAVLAAASSLYAANGEIGLNSSDIKEEKVSLGVSIDPSRYTVSGPYVDPAYVSDCAYRKDNHEPGHGVLADRAKCQIFDNGVKRKMLESELDAYLSLIRQIDLKHETAPLILDTNISGFDESALVAHFKNQGLTDDAVAKEVSDLRRRFNDTNSGTSLEIKSHFDPTKEHSP